MHTDIHEDWGVLNSKLVIQITNFILNMMYWVTYGPALSHMRTSPECAERGDYA